jgi:uncharacterized protein YdeI (YjbR/CyaY-like superfamily)
MNESEASRLKRTIQEMPDFVAEALRARNLEGAYEARPPYQRNDYLGWIARAKTEATRRKRLEQMLRELEGGTLYMNMSWSCRP